MRYGGVLTQIARREFYAACVACNLIYQDDAPQSGSVDCPSCKCAVKRGLTREQAMQQLDKDQKELLA